MIVAHEFIETSAGAKVQGRFKRERIRGERSGGDVTKVTRTSRNGKRGRAGEGGAQALGREGWGCPRSHPALRSPRALRGGLDCAVRRGGRDSVHFARGPGSDKPGYDCSALRARVWWVVSESHTQRLGINPNIPRPGTCGSPATIVDCVECMLAKAAAMLTKPQ